MKPIIIGQAPGPNTDPMRPLPPLPKSGSGGRIARFCDLSPEEYLETFDRTNLLYYFPGRWKRDDKWPRREAEIAAAAVKPFLRGRDVILLGRNVARAFGYPAQQLDFHTWFRDEVWGFSVSVVPHTSGRNKWYSKQNNEEVSREFWKALREELSRDSENRSLRLVNYFN